MQSAFLMTYLPGVSGIEPPPNDLLRSCAARVAAAGGALLRGRPALVGCPGPVPAPFGPADCRRRSVTGTFRAPCQRWSRASASTQSARQVPPRLDGEVAVKAPRLASTRTARRACRSGAPARIRLHFDYTAPMSRRDFRIDERCAGNTRSTRLHPRRPLAQEPADADWAVERRLQVRVVKGQWDDSERPATDPRSAFKRSSSALPGEACRSPSPRTIWRSLARHCGTCLRLVRNANWRCCYGLPLGPAVALARELGVPVRVYVPYGKAWLPYAISQIRDNPRCWDGSRATCCSVATSGCAGASRKGAGAFTRSASVVGEKAYAPARERIGTKRDAGRMAAVQTRVRAPARRGTSTDLSPPRAATPATYSMSCWR